MEYVRKFHNDVKKVLINSNVCKGHNVLDVGCGVGGDIHKWNKLELSRVDMCDPDIDSVEEAVKRIHKMKYKNMFVRHGDILCCNGKYDVICYNFSIQYIFEYEHIFYKSIDKIVELLKRNGGKLIGCIPDSDAIYKKVPFKDKFNNEILFFDDTKNKIKVKLTDTPFYDNSEYRTEPIAFRDRLVNELELRGLYLESWKKFPCSGEELTEMYSTFIFVKV